MSRRKRLDKHHIKPRSRFELGEDVDTDNTCYWETQFHRNWHAMFSNLTLEEVIIFIREVSQPNTVWDTNRLTRLMKEIKGEK